MIRPLVLLFALATPALSDEISADGGVVRVLDRMSDKVADLDLATGTEGTVGRLTVTLEDCRYPEGAPGESIGRLTILDSAAGAPVFDGWMSAASPALNPLDHPRYDVWLLQCHAPEGQAEDAPAEGN